jgi:hypothetical protein
MPSPPISSRGAAHQFVLAELDGKFAAALHQPQLHAAAGHVGSVEELPGNHGRLSSG